MGGARVADRGERRRPGARARVARGDAPRDPGCVADGHRAGPHRAVGLLVRRGGSGASARSARAGRAAPGGQRRLPGRPRRGSARPRDHIRHPARPGRPPVPVAFTLGMGAWAADQPPTGPWTPRPPWVFATLRRGRHRESARAPPRERARAPHGRDPDAPGIPRLSRRRAPPTSKARPMSSAGTSTSRCGSVAGWARRRSHERRSSAATAR